ncbi:unnamed protein product [Oppiella nova]|uniref:U1-type domain-containing protein n=1 Tax=Oppiella nova TaxID=334625 RepID=A0A7R9QMM6_9ACAR|nr:unnamed protein product [Oppiella nova]CAG2168871.1 unnamed protein product [Oppiella nova]
MDSDDMFLDSERLKKMIALGIYDDKTVDKVRNIKNKDLIDKTPVARPPDPLDTRPTPAPPNQPMGGRGGGGRRGGPHNRGGPEGWRSQRANPGRRDFGYGFNPIADSVVNWSTFGDNSGPKRPKTFTGDDSFRSSIRDGIQTKIQRNEDDRKMNIHLMGDRYPGNASIDTDLRPKSDTDLRFNSRKTADNSHLITSAATDEDFRGRGRRGRGMDHNRHFDADQRERDVFGERSAPRDPMLSQPVVDDIDDFIARAERAVSGKPSTPQKRKHEMSGSGRGGPHRPDQRPAHQKPLFERPRRIDDNMSQRRSGALFGSNDSSDEFKASDALNPSFGRRLPPERPVIEVLDEPRVESEANPVKQMEELRNTVEELSSSNLYCQYCDFYLSSFNHINSHIGTVLHQQNMAKKSMENSARGVSEQTASQSVPNSEPMSRTVVQRVPIGMAALVKMIDNRKQITLKSLTDMESYQICSDSEASLAKELAKLLTNELLNYKMSLMPDNVKERNEDDRKMNIHLMGDRYPGNASIDTDLRPNSDTDLRFNSRKTADNSHLITSAATDEDFRGRGRRGRGMDHNRHFDADQRERDVFGERSAPRDPMLSQPVVDDIDDFIARAERAVSGKPSTPQKRKHEMSGSGRGGPHRPDQRPADQKPLFERPRRIDDNMSQRRSGALFGSNDSSDEFKASDALNPSFGRRLPPERPVIEVLDEPRVESEANPVKQMEELRNTVEELSSSNLYCQYCDFYLSSFNHINSHIGTVLHQQNMAKKSMENSARGVSEQTASQSVPNSEPMSRTVVQRVPIGMAALVKMIDNRKQITLKSLTDMESYQICSDSEASLAKELAKLLTNELLNYKMSLMPDNVKEALKHQGIGLLKSATNM